MQAHRSVDNPNTLDKNERDQNIPAWADQIYSPWIIAKWIGYWGYNPDNYGKTSELGKLIVDGDDIDQVMNAANTNLVLIAYITSNLPDNSNVGIMLVDPRTAEATFYRTRGTTRAMAVKSAAENVFPPVPSEVIMPLAGYLASRGDMNFIVVVLAGTAGSLAGASFWFWVGARINRERLRGWIRNHGAFLAMTEEDLDRADAWFARHGARSVFLGRLVPVVRTLISVPAGVACMPVPKFALYTLLGTGMWTTALAAGGWVLGRQFRQIEHYLGIITWIVIGIVVLLYMVRVVRLKRSGAASYFGNEPAD